MSLYTRKEFAALCRTTTAVVTTNINRSKILLFDKKIDSENKINSNFFNKYSKKAELELKKNNLKKDSDETIEDLYNKVVHKVSTKVSKKKKDDKKEKERQDALENAIEESNWDIRKKKAETLLKERQAEKERMQLEKLAGKLLPTEVTFNILRVHNQSIFSTFQNDVENLASIFCDILASGDRKVLAELNDKIGKVISVSIKRAEDVAIAGIKNEIEKYSDTRDRGQRK